MYGMKKKQLIILSGYSNDEVYKEWYNVILSGIRAFKRNSEFLIQTRKKLNGIW